MELRISICDVTLKRKWNIPSDCENCIHRFECFTSNIINVDPVNFKLEIDRKYQQCSWYYFEAKFVVPKCLRLGLLKHLNDGGAWFDDHGFPYAKLFPTDERKVFVKYAWVKFPNTVNIEGTLYRKEK